VRDGRWKIRCWTRDVTAAVSELGVIQHWLMLLGLRLNRWRAAACGWRRLSGPVAGLPSHGSSPARAAVAQGQLEQQLRRAPGLCSVSRGSRPRLRGHRENWKRTRYQLVRRSVSGRQTSTRNSSIDAGRQGHIRDACTCFRLRFLCSAVCVAVGLWPSVDSAALPLLTVPATPAETACPAALFPRCSASAAVRVRSSSAVRPATVRALATAAMAACQTSSWSAGKRCGAGTLKNSCTHHSIVVSVARLHVVQASNWYPRKSTSSSGGDSSTGFANSERPQCG